MTINEEVVILTTSISPMLNPFIYTLRNKQVKQAFSDLLKNLGMQAEVNEISKKEKFWRKKYIAVLR